ncbi:MAG: succinate dehydrogenase, hydrophobic membrane anchor protein [Alphaproteobacteria bacterium]
MKLRTPLARARGLGAAKTGVEHWWAQRWTALALIPLVIWFVISVITHVGAEHGVVVAWIGNPVTAVLLVLLIAAVFHHGQLGLQAVIEDYVPNEFVKLGSILAVKGGAILLSVAGILAVLRIALGGGA